MICKVTNEYPSDSEKASLRIQIKDFNTVTTKGLISDEYPLFNNTVTCRLRVTYSGGTLKCFVQLKTVSGVPSSYLLNIPYNYIDKKCDVCREGLWQYVGGKYVGGKADFFFYLEYRRDKIRFEKLYIDTEFTDFKLYGGNDATEAVSVHRNILAVSSPVLKSMLLGDWKEAIQGNVHLPYVSKNTLQHFKDYIYLNKFPVGPLDCAKLLYLASYYMLLDLSELKKVVAVKMADTFKPDNAWEWFDFCVQHKDANLLLLRLHHTGERAIENLVQHFLKGPYKAVFEIGENYKPPYDLYEETDFTDFELRVEGDDGTHSAVCVHQNVLAVFSPVFKTLLLGDWKEAKHGFLQPSDVSKLTLQHFKDYIYLLKLPDASTDCAKLMPLASYYKMPEFERDIALKIADNLKPENIWEWLEYCLKKKNDYLLVAILKNIYEYETLDSWREYFSKQ